VSEWCFTVFLSIVLSITQLLDSVGSVVTVRSVLKHILDLVLFSVPFPKLSKTLLKVRISIIPVRFCVSLLLCVYTLHVQGGWLKIK